LELGSGLGSGWGLGLGLGLGVGLGLGLGGGLGFEGGPRLRERGGEPSALDLGVLPHA
jgi:hypothetical protein